MRAVRDGGGGVGFLVQKEEESQEHLGPSSAPLITGIPLWGGRFTVFEEDKMSRCWLSNSGSLHRKKSAKNRKSPVNIDDKKKDVIIFKMQKAGIWTLKKTPQRELIKYVEDLELHISRND